jgi:hypothetical protein
MKNEKKLKIKFPEDHVVPRNEVLKNFKNNQKMIILLGLVMLLFLLN